MGRFVSAATTQLRIAEIEGKLSACQVIDPSTLDAGGKVVFGSTIELQDEDSGDKVTYQIVGEDEADLKKGLISISSPIARALIGKSAGDVAEVQAPGGVRHYEIRFGGVHEVADRSRRSRIDAASAAILDRAGVVTRRASRLPPHLQTSATSMRHARIGL